MSKLQFEDYYLKELSYKRNDSFNNSKEINLMPKLSAQIVIKKKNDTAYIDLLAKHGNLDDPASAFEVTINIVGIFKYSNEDPEYTITFENFLRENGLAILWSYIRPMISDIISRGNEFPTFILPVINVRKMLEDSDSITITYDD